MGLSKSALFYRKNKSSREHKKDYDTEYGKSEERKNYRVELNRERRRRKLKGDPRDLSHTKKGTLVLESRKANRRRNGHGNTSTLK